MKQHAQLLKGRHSFHVPDTEPEMQFIATCSAQQPIASNRAEIHQKISYGQCAGGGGGHEAASWVWKSTLAVAMPGMPAAAAGVRHGIAHTMLEVASGQRRWPSFERRRVLPLATAHPAFVQSRQIV